MTSSKKSKKDYILDAALDLFDKNGYEGTAVPQIAKKAKVAVGTIYHYFKNKEEVVNTLYRVWKKKSVEIIIDNFPFNESAKIQFETLWPKLLNFALDNPKAYKFVEFHYHAPYLDKESITLKNNMNDFVKKIIIQAKQESMIKNISPEIIIAMIYGAMAGIIKAQANKEFLLTEEIILETRQCMWNAIKS